MINRRVTMIKTPQASPGFLGKGHIAVNVVDGTAPKQTDPFILLMDDHLDLPGNEVVGGAHPHAGFEIATLVLEGETGIGKHGSATGDLEWLTAGSGVVHTEEIKSSVKLRVLQLWIKLPKDKIWIEPKWQKISKISVPALQFGGSEVLVYSGKAFGLSSPLHTEVPTLILHCTLATQDELEIPLPSNYNVLIYMLNGSVYIGEDESLIRSNQTVWLDKPAQTTESYLKVKGSNALSIFVLYAAQPQGYDIFRRGPFISDEESELQELYAKFRSGQMPHVTELSDSHRITY